MKQRLKRQHRLTSIPMMSLLTAGLLLGVTACGNTNAHTASNATQKTSSQTSMNMANHSATSGASLNQAPVPMKLVRHGQSVNISMTTQETTVDIGNGMKYHAWTFDGTAPGPVLYLQQGDDVTLHLHNLDPQMAHSIDLHAAVLAPNQGFVEVLPHQSTTLHFVANVPGVFMYHCGTEPMLLHIGNGMYGAVVVTPRGLPKPTFTIVQSEFYQNGDYQTMLNGTPEAVVFNGQMNRYVMSPLHVKAGQPVTIAFVNAGPNLFSAFHIVGTILGEVNESGNPQNHVYNVQTYPVAPGDGALIHVRFEQPGLYSFVSHSMSSMEKGAMGKFVVSP